MPAHARPPSRLTLLADRCAHTGPRSVPSWPVNGDRPLTTPEGTLPLEEAVYKGFKLFHGAAAEARSLAGIMIYLAWCADPVAMAHLLGIEEPDPYEALMYVLDAVKEGTKVMIVGAAPCYLHLAGVPGFPQLIARMQLSYIVRSEEAFEDISFACQKSHWLSTPAGDGKQLWETMPYLLVGASPWDTDVTSFPQPSMERYGRVGAPGSPWWVAVK